MCKKPRFVSIKKDIEKHLKDIQFVCKNRELGCEEVLGYAEVQTHDQVCQYLPIKCTAYTKCKTKCIRMEIDKHKAVCPNVLVPCIYCRGQVERVNIISHE